MELNNDFVSITVQPDDLNFAWPVDVYLSNFLSKGLLHTCHVLIYVKSDNIPESPQPYWQKLIKKYPEAKFFFYMDTENFYGREIKPYGYIPLLRPWCLEKHFTRFPELKDKVIFYHDSDIVLTDHPFEINELCKGEVNYLTKTYNGSKESNYLDYYYFEDIINKVKPELREAWIEWDVLSRALKGFGLSKEFLKEQSPNTGGAQYILKNIDADFWRDVRTGCKFLLLVFDTANNSFMPGSTPIERLENGIQAWCVDMWSLLWNLWKRGYKTECPPSMDMCWATDLIDKWNKASIYHDAGASARPVEEGHWLFHKRNKDYVNNIKTPFEDDLSYVSPKYCSYNYVKEIEAAKLWDTLPLEIDFQQLKQQSHGQES